MLDLQKSSSSPFNSCDEKNSNNRKVVPFNQQYADCDIQAVSFKMGSYNNSFNQVEEKNGIQFLQESNLQLTNQQQSNQKKLDTQYDDTIFKTFYPTSDAIEQNITNSHQKNNQIIMDDKTSTQQNIKIQSNKLQKQNTLNTTQKELVASNLKEKENSVFQQSEYLSRFNSGSIIQAKGESKVAQSNQKSHSFGNALLVKKFINKLKAKSTNYILNLITQNIFELIYDKSSDYNQFTNQRKLKQKDKEKTLIHKLIIRTIDYIYKAFLNQNYIFLPENILIFIWEVLLSIYLLSQIIIQPLRDSFPTYLDYTNNDMLFFHQQILPICIFATDTFFLFNTAIFKNGQIIKDRKFIFKTALQKHFIFELIVITLYYIGTSFTDYSVLKYSILLKSFEFFSLFKKFCNLFDHNQNGLIYTQSALIVLQIFILAHISACIFITVANASAPSITWITKLQEVTEITNLTISQIYVSALYWSIITMVTLGYGDIVPISQNEKLFVIFIAFVSCGLFGYSFNLISEIINESQKNKNKIKNDLEMLNNLIDERGLSNELKNKVRRYFEYLYKEKMKNTEIGYEMIGTLPPNLKDEVMNDLYSKILKQHPLFSKNFSDQFIAELSLTMKELKVGPELIILKKQQIQDKLYFILNGEVNSYLQKLTNVNNIIEQLTKGAVIGLQEFITQTPIEYFYKSESVASLGYIEYSEFYETLKKHPKDYEIYYKIKDKLSVYREGSACRLFCRFCKKSVHSSDECPLITYQPNINKIVYKLKQLELIQQDRDSYKRVNKQKQNSRHIFTTINDNANKVANDLVNNLQKSQETYEQSKQEIIDSLIQNQYNNEKLENESSKENKIEEQLQSIRQRRISFQLSLARKSIEHSHIFSNNTQFFYQKENSKTQYEQEENLIAESQNKLNSIDNLPQIEKTSEQPVNQKNFNNFNQLEEIKEIIHQNSNQNEGGEGSQYFSYFDQSFAQQDKINFDEEQNQNLDKIQTFNLFQIEPSSNKSFQNNLIQQNSPIKRRSQFYDQNQFEKCYSENKSVSEELVSTKCLEKSKTFTNFLFDQDNLVRFHRKKLSNVIINPNFNIFDTPLSQKHPKRTTSNNTQLHLISLQSQQNQQQQQQQLQISPTNSQTNIQHIFEEEYQLPFILLNDFDKFQNYIYYFPHNNPSLILRNIEDQRLQRIERQRKLKQKKNQNEKSKFVSSNIPDKKN
ncbi:cyclic nucleotide-binding domain protein (macronuclear) [Tetrahymena thermophila SB210]|uniref:Cyclic nucleotide-binding domain protein n=1 Tax=Tetrahymena thermophila (strain SB210) TaxID=312017 RepID=W7X482_TETTS|nr:cyclic nucleotide-binding domain protein [Tetrahymena thermophila SB210]EWS72247.1 cyclic nucleotide-binding domain protein [Tetrahymena thermophila SB210]|eukprot:XP_012655187.1 cyclic nucleotide-binding domain protein [Tetrahymena thermophila SB210]